MVLKKQKKSGNYGKIKKEHLSESDFFFCHGIADNRLSACKCFRFFSSLERNCGYQFSISNPEELAGLAKLVNDGTTNFEGVTITLEADLQMNPLTNWEKWETAEAQPSNTWIPIGIVNQSLFHGIFDGNGHTISGLYRFVCRTLPNSNGKKSDD